MEGSGIKISRKAWYLARKKYEKYGFVGLLDRRGMKGGRRPRIDSGQLEKISDLVWEDISLKEFQQTIKKEFGVRVSIRQGRRLLRMVGIIRKPGRLKRTDTIDKEKGIPIDHAGVYFLKVADADMQGGKTITERIVEGREKEIDEKNALGRIRGTGPETIKKKVETLLYLPMFNMQKPYHLLKHHKKGLGLLTGSGKRYSYYTADIFLCDIEKLEIAKKAGESLARCYLEALCIEIELEDGSYFYIDGHAKHVWSSSNIPKAFFTTLKRAERGLNQYFIHSSKGNPLILLTCPGDTRLPGVIFDLIDAFENAVGKKILKAVIFDREGLSLSIFTEFEKRNKYFITLLRNDMYKGEESLNIHKDFKPLKIEKKEGELKVLEWVADAEYELKDRETKRKLTVRVALVKKTVNGRVKLIPIITNLTCKEESDIARIVKRYFDRWPNQENMFRDAREALKVDTNHGYKKEEVPNRVVQRKKEELETNLRGIIKKLGRAREERKKAAGQMKKVEEMYKHQRKELQKERTELYAKIVLTEQAKESRNLLKDLRRIEKTLAQISKAYGRQFTQLKATMNTRACQER